MQMKTVEPFRAGNSSSMCGNGKESTITVFICLFEVNTHPKDRDTSNCH